jgi:hypothetical protein
MAVDPEDIGLEDYNKKVTDWGSKVAVKLRTSIRTLTRNGKGELLKSLRLKTAKWFGEVDKLSYHFKRHGVFVHKGVGRGYTMWNGSVMKHSGTLAASAAARGMKTDPRFKDRIYKPMDPGRLNRVSKEWFNPIVKSDIDKLADLVAEIQADRTVSATKILIR